MIYYMCISIHIQLYRSIRICAVYVHTYRSACPVPNICPRAHRHSTRQPAQFHPLHPWRIPEQCSAPCQFPKLYRSHHRRVHSSLICFIWPTQIHSQISQALLQVSTQAVGIQLTLGQEAFSAVWSFFLQFRRVSIELELYSAGKRGKPFRHPQTLNTCKGAHECPCNVMTTCEYQGRAPVELAKVQILSLLQFQPKEAAPTPRLIRHGGSPASSAWSQASDIHGMPY